MWRGAALRWTHSPVVASVSTTVARRVTVMARNFNRARQLAPMISAMYGPANSRGGDRPVGPERAMGDSREGDRPFGPHFTVRGALDVLRPSDGRPLIVASRILAGRPDLAARWADAIYAGGSTLETGTGVLPGHQGQDRLLRPGSEQHQDPARGHAFLGETEQAARDFRPHWMPITWRERTPSGT